MSPKKGTINLLSNEVNFNTSTFKKGLLRERKSTQTSTSYKKIHINEKGRVDGLHYVSYEFLN